MDEYTKSLDIETYFKMWGEIEPTYIISRFELDYSGLTESSGRNSIPLRSGVYQSWYPVKKGTKLCDFKADAIVVSDPVGSDFTVLFDLKAWSYVSFNENRTPKVIKLNPDFVADYLPPVPDENVTVENFHSSTLTYK